MVVLKKLLSRRGYKIVEALATQVMMIAIVGPFFFIFFFMFWNSLKPDYLFFEPGTWVFDPMWSNYIDVYEQSDLVRNIGNSLIISSLATLIGLACGLLTAYTVASAAIRPLGFRWVSLDLDGYRTGSLNEVLQIRSDPSASS